MRLKYKDLIQVGEEAARDGVKAIQLVGWNRGGQDRGNPSQNTDDRLETVGEFKDAIARVQCLGVNIVLFNKYTWADVTTEGYKHGLQDFTARDPYGDPYLFGGWEYQTPTQLADMNTRRLVAMCPASDKWRETAASEFQKILNYDAAGMLYDEVAWHGPAQYFFSPKHGHHVPTSLFAGDTLLAKRFRAMAEVQRPEFLFAGEAPTDVESQYYYLSYYRIGPGNVPVDRYINPFKPIMVAVIGYDDREMINNSLMDRFILSYEPLNFKGKLSDFPLTIAYGKKVDALRKRHKEYPWESEFRDTLGAEVEVDGKPCGRYAVFGRVESGKRAIVIVNDDAQKPITARVELEAASKELFWVTPEDMVPKPSTGTITIPARSAGVLLEGWHGE